MCNLGLQSSANRSCSRQLASYLKTWSNFDVNLTYNWWRLWRGCVYNFIMSVCPAAIDNLGMENIEIFRVVIFQFFFLNPWGITNLISGSKIKTWFPWSSIFFSTLINKNKYIWRRSRCRLRRFLWSFKCYRRYFFFHFLPADVNIHQIISVGSY